VTEIERRLHITLETVQERVVYLEQFNARWTRFQSRLDELQDWTQHSAPGLLEQVQAADLTPEERVKRSQVLQGQLAEKVAVLDVLSQEARGLVQDDADNVEAEQLRLEVERLRSSVLALNHAVDNQISSVGRDLVNWQEYKSGLQEIKPWVEQAEVKVTMGMPKPVSLQEAQQLLDSARDFEQQCEGQLTKLQGVAALGQQITCRTNAADEVDAVHSRWTAVHDQALQWGTRLEKLVGTWQEFDGQARGVDEWLQKGQRAIDETPVHINTTSVSKLEKEMARLKVGNISRHSSRC
ncbi:unnamed protein product, partial [Timema podura]|nr:unnamed protein product [Timema podura]